MKQKVKHWKSCLVLMAATVTALSGCSKDDATGNEAGNSVCEIRLASGVQVQSRAGTAPDTQIPAGATVYAWVDEATSPAATGYIKAWTLTADGSGTLNGATHRYFPASGKNIDFYAMHGNFTTPFTEDATAFPASGVEHTVAADQRGDGYVSSDLLYAARTGVTRRSNAVALTFYHLLSKVEVALKSGSGTPDLTGATVTIGGTKLKTNFIPVKTADINNATPATAQAARASLLQEITGNNPPASISIPTVVNTSGFGEGTTYGAGILVPQVLTQDTKFITVTLANGVTFSYKIPAGGLTLESGKKYQYHITVNLTGLTVSSTIDNWDTTAPPVDDDATLPGPIGNKTPAQAAVGDFYMSDGTLVAHDATLTEVQQDACIGIVFCTDVNRIGASAIAALGGRSNAHGLVMALTNAIDYSGWGDPWQDEYSGVIDGPFHSDTETVKKMYENVDGYAETHWIGNKIKNGGYDVNTYKAFKVALNYGTSDNQPQYAALATTSGWFLPSIGQWWDILELLGNVTTLNSQHDNTSPNLNLGEGVAASAINKLNAYLSRIPLSGQLSLGDSFWSSSEFNEMNACCVYFDYGFGSVLNIQGENKQSPKKVRPILAF